MKKTITPFTSVFEDFINFKRCENYKYKSEEDMLWSFNDFLSKNNLEETIFTKAIITEWCKQRFNESRKSMSNRTSTIRQFMIYLMNRGYDVYIPDFIRNTLNKSFIPYIFSTDEIEKIFRTVDTLPSGHQNNSDTVYPVLLRVLYGCGLRISEALELRIEDVDIEKGILHIKHAKYNKKRIVPMSESLKMVCQRYYDRYLVNIENTDYFFRNKYGGRRRCESVSSMFRKILSRSCIPYRGKGLGPRLHDLRHTFCCHSIKYMSDQGIDFYCTLPILSTYVGHATIQATERYVRLSKEIYPEIELKITPVTGKIYPEVFDE